MSIVSAIAGLWRDGRRLRKERRALRKENRRDRETVRAGILGRNMFSVSLDYGYRFIGRLEAQVDKHYLDGNAERRRAISQNRTVTEGFFVLSRDYSPIAWYSEDFGWYIPFDQSASKQIKNLRKFTIRTLHKGKVPHTLGPKPEKSPRKKSTKKEKTMAEAAEKKEVPTIGALRARAKAEGVEQIETWDDPRLVKLIEGLHKFANNSSYCETFDTLAKGEGIPARPKETYFKISREGKVNFGGQDYPVIAQIEVYGEEGDEDGAIENYEARFGLPFDDALKKAFQKNALVAIQESLVVIPA